MVEYPDCPNGRVPRRVMTSPAMVPQGSTPSSGPRTCCRSVVHGPPGSVGEILLKSYPCKYQICQAKVLTKILLKNLTDRGGSPPPNSHGRGGAAVLYVFVCLFACLRVSLLVPAFLKPRQGGTPLNRLKPKTGVRVKPKSQPVLQHVLPPKQVATCFPPENRCDGETEKSTCFATCFPTETGCNLLSHRKHV